MKSISKKQKGFSLLELLISLFLFSLSILSLLHLQLNLNLKNQLARDKATAYAALISSYEISLSSQEGAAFKGLKTAIEHETSYKNLSSLNYLELTKDFKVAYWTSQDPNDSCQWVSGDGIACLGF